MQGHHGQRKVLAHCVEAPGKVSCRERIEIWGLQRRQERPYTYSTFVYGIFANGSIMRPFGHIGHSGHAYSESPFKKA